MRFAAGPPSRWKLTLRDGAALWVWADAYAREGDDYVFSSLFDLDADEELPANALVSGPTPSNPRRYLLAVTRIPVAAVVETADGEAIETD